MSHSSPPPPRWLHAWAVLTVLATLPLLFLGAEVTTKGAGMADPVGYWHPWDLLQKLADATGLGLRIEYGHRMAGFVVGTATIVLVAGLWLCERRRWVCWVGTLALLMVGAQGTLGRFRVDLNALVGRDLALIHGCFAQLVIAVLVSIALFTSRGWTTNPIDVRAPTALRRWALLTVALVYAQLVLGGVLRHKDFLLGSRLHLLGAFAVLGAMLWLVKLARTRERPQNLAFSLKVLSVLVGIQMLLGIEAWLSRAQGFFVPGAPLPLHTDWIRSGHYVVGTLIFAASVVVALKTNRRPAEMANPAPTRVLEGAL